AVVVLGSPLSNEAEIAYQLQHSGAQILLTLSSYHVMVERVCTTTDIKQVIYSNVREYLPVRQRVKLASLIDESSNAIHLSHSQSSAHASHPGLIYDFQQLLRSQPMTPLSRGIDEHDLALLQYTSGTTDTPKGVMLSH